MTISPEDTSLIMIKLQIFLFVLQIAAQWWSPASQDYRMNVEKQLQSYKSKEVSKYYHWYWQQNNTVKTIKSSNPNDTTSNHGAKGAKLVFLEVLQTLSLMSITVWMRKRRHIALSSNCNILHCDAAWAKKKKKKWGWLASRVLAAHVSIHSSSYISSCFSSSWELQEHFIDQCKSL